MSASTEFVTLKTGVVVPAPAVLFALDLEARGFEILPDGGDGILVGPRSRLTDDLRGDIRRWRSHIAAILAACDEGAVQ